MAFRTVAVSKPVLRGWLHLVTCPLAIAAGVVLVTLAPTLIDKLACATFTGAAALMFGASALFHRGHWGPTVNAALRRLDHSNIFLLIAGTYTPFAILLLNDRNTDILLGIVWGGALVGIAFRIFWLGAPRWLYLPVYVALGWAAIFWLGDFEHRGGTAVVVLIIAGGALYSLGALAYGLRRPNPFPRWFGFHEVFHSCTIAAFALHYIAISLVVYSLA